MRMNQYIMTPDDELEELIYQHESKIQDYYDKIDIEMRLEEKMFKDIIASEPIIQKRIKK